MLEDNDINNFDVSYGYELPVDGWPSPGDRRASVVINHEHSPRRCRLCGKLADLGRTCFICLDKMSKQILDAEDDRPRKGKTA